MEKRQQYSHLIYEYFLLRFRFGYYQFGDVLPPIETFCREFCVADQTVKAALHRLRDEGYIEMSRGRQTRVLFHQTEEQLHSFIVEHFSERWHAFSDLYASAELLFVPLLVEGFRRMSKEELDLLSHFSVRAGMDDLLFFYCLVLQKLRNPLAMNFFWETSLFQGFPLAKLENRPTQYGPEVIRKRMSQLISYAENQQWDMLQDALVDSLHADIDRLTAYCDSQIKSLPEARRLKFEWRIYRDRPQLCYRLAFDLLHEIYMGKYREVSYLPSYSELAEMHKVSVNTVRRAVGMLNKIGAVQTVNGKGTFIYGLGKQCNPPDCTDPMIRRNFPLYIQSFELALCTCEFVVRAFLRDMTEEERNELLCQLRQNLRLGHAYASIWNCLLHIVRHSRLQVVREFYGKIYGLFLWGHPLKASLAETPELDEEAVLFTEAMIRYLEENDVEQCTATLKGLLAGLFPKAERYLLQQGIKPEEIRISNAIRFLAVEDYSERLSD